MPFDPAPLRDLLVCPRSKSPLVLDGSRLVCRDPACRLAYDIRDDIPILLVDEATPLEEAEWADVMRRHGREDRP
ncbi:MAG: Trm112 family protein [Planctomycetales bacterium]